ncbi:hypothetical protein HDV02_002095 [Globomyces sp. JEL0801]|nr:hypothetical protein HDV02_002095 [Globomyces sp. JEL0801]
MKSFLSILTFFIITTIAVPQAPTALQATMPELASYKWVCREHDQVRDVSSEDTVCRWVASKDLNDFNGSLENKMNLLLLASVLILLH